MSTTEPTSKLAALISATAVEAPGNQYTSAQPDSPHPSTTDYDMFHLVPGNRPVTRAAMHKLMRDISRNNLLYIRPMDVTTDMGVIDGQHRLAVARELGVPIYYRVVGGLDESHTINLNQKQRNWRFTDYLHYWTVRGKPAYQALTAFCERNPELHLTNAILIMQGIEGRSEPAFEMFIEGTWLATEEAPAQRLADIVNDVANRTCFSQAYSVRFVRALVYCLTSVKGLVEEQFLNKLTKPGALVECANYPQYVTSFQELYNYGLSQDNRLKFKQKFR